MAEPLKIASAAADLLFCRQQPDIPVRKADHRLFPFVDVLAPVHLHRFRHRLFNRVSLRFQVVPQKEMRFRIAVHNLLRLFDPNVDTFPLFPRRVRKAQCRVPHHLCLAELVKPGSGVVHLQPVIPNVHVRQPIPSIVIPKVARILNTQRPCAHPQPEFFLFVRIQRQVVRFRAVPLKKTGQRLPCVHHVQVSGIVNQLFIPVRRGCGRRDQFVLHVPEFRQKCLVGLAPETTQHAGLVQAGGREIIRADISVTYPLIVRHEDFPLCRFHLFHGPHIARRVLPSKHAHRVPGKFLFHPKRQHDQRLPAFLFRHQAAKFQLLHRLPQAEALKQGPFAPPYGPDHRVPLVRFQRRVHLGGVHLEPTFRRDHHLSLQKVHVSLYILHVWPLSAQFSAGVG